MKRLNFFLFISLLVIALYSTVSVAQPGLYTAINTQGVTQVVNQVIPPFFAQIKGKSFPDVKDGHHRILNIRLVDIGMEAFNMDINNESIGLNISRFHTRVDLKYRYKRKLFSISANVEIRLGDANFNIRLKLSNSNGKFGLGVQSVNVNAGEAAIKIKGSSLKSKFLNAIKSLFKSRIKKTILEGIRDAMKTSINAFANDFINKLTLRANVGNWGSADLSLVNAIRYEKNNIIVGFSGEIQNIDTKAPTGVPRHGITFAPTDRLFSIGLDTFVFNSGFKTFYVGNKFSHMSTKAAPNGYKGVKLETNEWGKSIPALKTKHPNLDMRLRLNFGGEPVLTSAGGQLKFSAPIHVHVQMGSGNNWADAFILEVKLNAAATVTITNGLVLAQIQDVTTTLSVVKTNIGNIDTAVDVVQHLVQFTLDISVPIINQQLLAGIPLPISNNIAISNAKLTLPQNGIVFGADVKITF